MLSFLKKNKNLIEKLNFAFICVFTVYTILREVIPIKIYVGSSIVSYAAFGMCLVFLIINLLSDKKFFMAKELILFTAFFGATCISVLINRDFDFKLNLNALLWTAAFFFYIFPTGKKIFSNNKNFTKIYFSVVVITFVLLMLVSLTTYFFDVDYTFYKTDGTLTNQGFSNDYVRLWGVFQEANYGAVYTSVALVMAVYLFIKTKKIAARIFLAAAGVLFLTFIVLSGSRTTQLVTSIACGWLGFYTAFTKLQKDTLKKIIFSALACFLSAAVYLGIFYGIKTVLPYTKAALLNTVSSETYASVHKLYDSFYKKGEVNIIEGYYVETTTEESTKAEESTLAEETTLPEETTTEEPTASQETTLPEETTVSEETTVTEETTLPSQPPVTEEPTTNKVVKLERPDLNKDGDISNGRLRRWKDGLSIFKSAPIFGASPRGVYKFAQVHNPETTMAKYYYSISNIYLEILVETGIVGFCILLLMLLHTVFTVFFKKLKYDFSFTHLIFSLIIFIPACAAVLQSDLFFNLTFGGTVFWFTLGAVSNQFPTKTIKHKDNDDTVNVLVFGLKEPVGGLEKVVQEYVKPLKATHKINFDFLLFDKNFSAKKEFEESGSIVYITSRKENYNKYKTELKNIFEAKTYDAVWGNYTGLTNIDLLITAKEYNVPVRIAHSHVAALSWGSTLMKYVVKVLHHYNKARISDFATHYWGCSELACSFMFPEEKKDKFTVIKNAVDLSVFSPDKTKGDEMRKQLNIPADATVVAHVARMCKEKNQAFLLTVFAGVLKKLPDAVLLFVGDGEYREQLEARVRELGIEENVIFTGHRSDVADYLQAADVFVLPSIAEGLGLCAIEAQATGVPCVVSDVVPREIDISGTTEFVSLDDSAEKWADTVIFCSKKAIPDPTKCVIDNNYEIKTQAEKIYSVFTGK